MGQVSNQHLASPPTPPSTPLQDLMAPYFFHGVRARMTSVTLALLEDSGWYTPRWDYVQPVEGRPVTGCDVSLSPCEDHNTRLPGAYYCSSPTPAYAAYVYGSSPAAPAARPCLSPLVQAACGEVTPFSDGCGVLRAGVACTDEAGVGGAYPPEMDENGDEAGVFLGFGAYFGADSRCMMYGAKEVGACDGQLNQARSTTHTLTCVCISVCVLVCWCVPSKVWGSPVFPCPARGHTLVCVVATGPPPPRVLQGFLPWR